MEAYQVQEIRPERTGSYIIEANFYEPMIGDPNKGINYDSSGNISNPKTHLKISYSPLLTDEKGNFKNELYDWGNFLSQNVGRFIRIDLVSIHEVTYTQKIHPSLVAGQDPIIKNIKGYEKLENSEIEKTVLAEIDLYFNKGGLKKAEDPRDKKIEEQDRKLREMEAQIAALMSAANVPVGNEEDESMTIEEARTEYENLFGEKPHGKKSLSTLLKEIEDAQ